MVTIADYAGIETAWCPGCGNFGILSALKKALVELGKKPENIVIVSGIGQAAKLPHYLKCNLFNGLHGRALPAAFGIKVANPRLDVLVTTGDGDCYGEGGNHFLNAIRRNINITLLVHDNEIYGLTKGQASPTTQQTMKTKVQTAGVRLTPFKPLAVAIAAGCGFVARSFSGNPSLTVDLIQQAVRHKGFSIVDILQPCVTFNPSRTYEWYRSHTYTLGEHDPSDITAAFRKALEWDEKIPLGVLYRRQFPSFLDHAPVVKEHGLVDESGPAHDRLFDIIKKEFL
ncbi:MAG: 2-oxoacid ferredoxin oxidoreductase [Elusimicrobia bacterium]|nr:2-oxoacid ferredoxin oxidoreductase [Elusimicrobiota bacterium]MBD3411566.1 2-oxoacid ferredoxin oxidoreductase [Elusimicrobiota bacterium]